MLLAGGKPRERPLCSVRPVAGRHSRVAGATRSHFGARVDPPLLALWHLTHAFWGIGDSEKRGML